MSEFAPAVVHERFVLFAVVSISSGFIPAFRTLDLFEILTLPNQLSIWTPNVIEVDADEEEEEA